MPEEVEVHGLEVVYTELLHPHWSNHRLSGVSMRFLSLDRQSVVGRRGVFPVDVLEGVGVCVRTVVVLFGFDLDVGSELVDVALL